MPFHRQGRASQQTASGHYPFDVWHSEEPVYVGGREDVAVEHNGVGQGCGRFCKFSRVQLSAVLLACNARVYCHMREWHGGYDVGRFAPLAGRIYAETHFYGELHVRQLIYPCGHFLHQVAAHERSRSASVVHLRRKRTPKVKVDALVAGGSECGHEYVEFRYVPEYYLGNKRV